VPGPLTGIKIEHPAGDPARMFGPMLQIESGVNPPFEIDNRSKRSIVLDLPPTTADGWSSSCWRASTSSRPTCGPPHCGGSAWSRRGGGPQPPPGVRTDHRL
jgi:hypothetical protein